MRIMPHCDVNCVSHCPMHCVSCSHFSPFVKPWFMPLESMIRDLNAVKPFLHFGFVAILGGEPLVHPQLLDFMREARNADVSDDVMVITNGRLLPRMSEAFWETLMALRISIYPGLDPDITKMAEERSRQHGFRLELMEFNEFFIQLKSAPDDGIKSFSECFWKSQCFTVHEGKAYLCPQSAFMHRVVPDLVPGADGLPLADLTEEKLTAFLDRTEPLTSCAHCTGGHDATVPWHESRTKAEWIEAATI